MYDSWVKINKNKLTRVNLSKNQFFPVKRQIIVGMGDAYLRNSHAVRISVLIFAPTSDEETDTRTNYFRPHKQSRDLKGEFKLFVSFTRPRRSRYPSRPLALPLSSFHPSSPHLILDTPALSTPLFRSFPLSLLSLTSRTLSPPLPPGWARVVAAVAAVHQERSRDASLRLKPID